MLGDISHIIPVLIVLLCNDFWILIDDWETFHDFIFVFTWNVAWNDKKLIVNELNLTQSITLKKVRVFVGCNCFGILPMYCIVVVYGMHAYCKPMTRLLFLSLSRYLYLSYDSCCFFLLSGSVPFSGTSKYHRHAAQIVFISVGISKHIPWSCEAKRFVCVCQHFEAALISWWDFNIVLHFTSVPVPYCVVWHRRSIAILFSYVKFFLDQLHNWIYLTQTFALFRFF